MSKLKIFFFFLSIEICSFYQFEQRFGSRNTEYDDCTSVGDTNKCLAFKFTIKGFQCCKVITSPSPICNPMISPIYLATNESAKENGKILNREFFGYNLINDKKTSISMNFECADGKISYQYESKNYTDKEQEKLKSPQHCLNHYNKKESTSKSTCFNSVVATAGNSGVSCGYYEFDLIMTDNSTAKYQTCFLYNDDIRTTKNMGYLIKQMAENIADREAINREKILNKYIMKGVNNQGKYFIYESLNDTVSTPPGSDGAKFLSNKFALLLILFYIFSY